jgi:hypothetical protein
MFSLAPEQEQLDFIEQFKQVKEFPSRDPVKFISLLEKHIDLATFIPQSFYNSYYASKTNQRDLSLESLLAVLLLIQFFKFAKVGNFVTLLLFSPQIRSFCKLDDEVPDESVLSKFKIRFENEIKLFFEALSLCVIDIFDEFDDSLSDNDSQKGLNEILVNDTSGLKPKVKENNPKTLESKVKQQTRYLKHLQNTNEDRAKTFDVYKAAFANMPKQSSANEAIRLGYANGHFGYFYKFGILTNGFGIPLHIYFPDRDFYDTFPEICSPEDEKYVFDNASLRPVISSFFNRIGDRRFTTFLGDSEFDSYDNFGYLKSLNFSRVLIPINERNTSVGNQTIPVNSENIPCCPKDTSLKFISDGSCKGENRSRRYKFVCPKSRKINKAWVSDCDDKCRPTNSTVTHYTYPVGDFRTFPGIQRGSVEWKKTYKIRTVVERELSSMKSHPALERPNTYNCASMRADVYLNASAKLVTAILAFAIGKPNYMRNLKDLLKAS